MLSYLRCDLLSKISYTISDDFSIVFGLKLELVALICCEQWAQNPRQTYFPHLGQRSRLSLQKLLMD